MRLCRCGISHPPLLLPRRWARVSTAEEPSMMDRTRNYAWFLYACVTRNPVLPTIFPLTLPTTYITRGGFRAPASLLTTLEPKERRS
eukprot:scaffold44_cov339-Pavlova_lutheri.AAC.3